MRFSLLSFIGGTINGMTELNELLNYYEQNLTDRIFRYTLANGVIIEIIFYREAFCHLLGIQHITKNRRCIGNNGYKQIRSGKLTIRSLKRINRAGFAKIKNRIEYFSLIGHLMEHGNVFRFYSKRAGNTRIQATFLIHEKESDLYLHLFLAKESQKSNIYVPISYIALTERDDNPTLYIAGQEHKKVTAIDILKIKTNSNSNSIPQ